MIRNIFFVLLIAFGLFCPASAISITADKVAIYEYQEEFGADVTLTSGCTLFSLAYTGTAATGHTVTWDMAYDGTAKTISFDGGNATVNALFTYPSTGDDGQWDVTAYFAAGYDLQDMVDAINEIDGFEAATYDINGRCFATAKSIKDISATAQTIATASASPQLVLSSLEVGVNVPGVAGKTHRIRGLYVYDTFGSGTGTMQVYKVDNANDEATLLMSQALTTQTAVQYKLNEILIDADQGDDIFVRFINVSTAPNAADRVMMQYSTLTR